MSALDTLLALIRAEDRLGYTAQQLRVWMLYDRCCHRRAVITPKPNW